MAASRLTDLLALSHVPRWSIVPRVREQSVADHVFRVIVIATEIADRMGLSAPTSLNSCSLMLAALYHDTAESRTADIPTPAKEILLNAYDERFCPWLASVDTFKDLNSDLQRTLALADLIEAYTWLERWGVGQHKQRVLVEMHKKLMVLTDYEEKNIDRKWRTIALTIMDEITYDSGR